MANVGPLFWYVRDNAPTSTIGWSAVTAWATGASKSAGALVRQSATPTVGNERVFVAIVAGTTHATTEPTWTVTKGGKTTDNTVTWQECTGQPGVNGDLTNTPTWLQNKNTSVSLGLIVQRGSAASLQIVSTAGTTGNGAEPSFSNTAGVTTADNTVTWTSLGAPGNFGNWAAPFARLQSAYATNWMAAGNACYLGLDHTETQSAALNLTSPGTVSSPCFVYSVPTGTIPPTTPTAGASMANTGAGTNVNIQGSVYYYGITFKFGTGANSGTVQFQTSNWQKYDTCAIQRVGTGNNNIFFAGAVRLDFVNTTFQFGNTSDTIQVNGNNLVNWRNTASAIAGATLPTKLFNPSATNGGTVIVEGVDLSALGSGKTLVQAASNGGAYSFYLIDCKLGSSVTISETPAIPTGPRTDAIRCDTSGTSYAQHRIWFEGSLDHETTIVRTGGASDGTTGLSWKIVTTANSSWAMPFEAFPISIWNPTTAANVTVTVYGIWGGGAVPNNDDIWIDAEYLGSASSPLASIASGTKASNIATGSALSSDSSTWGGSTTKFKMTATLSSPQPQQAGYLRVYVKCAKASATFYVDPLPVLS